MLCGVPCLGAGLFDAHQLLLCGLGVDFTQLIDRQLGAVVATLALPQ